MTIGVYWFYQTSLDRAIYVGSSVEVDKRIYAHIRHLNKNTHPNRHFQSVWNKYGSDDFSVALLEVAGDNQIEREQFWIDALDPRCNLAKQAGVNFSRGIKKTAEHNRKNADAQRGKFVSEETKEKIRIARSKQVMPSGRHHSDETKKKISMARKGIKLNLTDEQRESLRTSSTGRRHTEETKQLIREQRIGTKHSDESKRAMREAWTRRRKRMHGDEL